jgi:hypothetical protein
MIRRSEPIRNPHPLEPPREKYALFRSIVLTSGFEDLRFGSECHSVSSIAEIIMKTSTLLALLFIGGIIFYVTGGGALLGLGGASTTLPDTVTPPNATFMGSEQENPYAE